MTVDETRLDETGVDKLGINPAMNSDVLKC